MRKLVMRVDIGVSWPKSPQHAAQLLLAVVGRSGGRGRRRWRRAAGSCCWLHIHGSHIISTCLWQRDTRPALTREERQKRRKAKVHAPNGWVSRSEGCLLLAVAR